MFEENNSDAAFSIKIDDKTYTISIAETNVFNTKFNVESEGKYLCTLAMDEEGNWFTQAGELREDLIDKVGRAIEEHDMR